ncbi:MAG: flagellar basal body-associated FliL family protein [Candidatus Polarisedimenticolaceae bacterium]|nr:flagellar basal body-associated FliL family protein [Candidatus Polarisedimenticolaceae bacterium]
MRLALYTLLSIMLVLPCYSYAEEDETPAKPSYFSLKPSIVVNLRSGGKFARIDIQIMTLDEEQLENIKLHAPAIRHALILLLSDQDGKKLKTPDGKEVFRKAALSAAQGAIKELTGVDSINELYFTSFFVQ